MNRHEIDVVQYKTRILSIEPSSRDMDFLSCIIDDPETETGTQIVYASAAKFSYDQIRLLQKSSQRTNHHMMSNDELSTFRLLYNRRVTMLIDETSWQIQQVIIDKSHATVYPYEQKDPVSQDVEEEDGSISENRVEHNHTVPLWELQKKFLGELNCSATRCQTLEDMACMVAAPIREYLALEYRVAPFLLTDVQNIHYAVAVQRAVLQSGKIIDEYSDQTLLQTIYDEYALLTICMTAEHGVRDFATFFHDVCVCSNY